MLSTTPLIPSTLVYSGPGIPRPSSFVATHPFVQHLAMSALHGDPFLGSMMTREVIKGAFFKFNKELTSQFKAELLNELNNLTLYLPENEGRKILWQAFFGNILSLLPYTYPANGEKINLPILSENLAEGYKQIEYTISRINLFLKGIDSPMVALGLIPTVKDKESPNFLILPGTTYPPAEGFAASLISDFTPGYSIGKLAYQQNKTLFEAWWENLNNKDNCRLIGISLAGAMGLHFLRDYHHKFKRADLYVTPGVSYREAKQGLDPNCQVNIYFQPNDLATKVGFFPRGENISFYSIDTDQTRITKNLITSHLRSFTGCNSVKITLQDPDVENASYFRRVLTKVHTYAGPFLVFLPIISAYFLFRVVRKIVTVFENFRLPKKN